MFNEGISYNHLHDDGRTVLQHRITVISSIEN